MFGQFKKELSGGERDTTNNRMELTGVIEGLKALKEPCIVELYPTQVRHRRAGKGLGRGLAEAGLGQERQKSLP